MNQCVVKKFTETLKKGRIYFADVRKNPTFAPAFEKESGGVWEFDDGNKEMKKTSGNIWKLSFKVVTFASAF